MRSPPQQSLPRGVILTQRKCSVRRGRSIGSDFSSAQVSPGVSNPAASTWREMVGRHVTSPKRQRNAHGVRRVWILVAAAHSHRYGDGGIWVVSSPAATASDCGRPAWTHRARCREYKWTAPHRAHCTSSESDGVRPDGRVHGPPPPSTSDRPAFRGYIRDIRICICRRSRHARSLPIIIYLIVVSSPDTRASNIYQRLFFRLLPPAPGARADSPAADGWVPFPRVLSVAFAAGLSPPFQATDRVKE